MKGYLIKIIFLHFLLFCFIVSTSCKKLEKEMVVSTGEVTNILINSAEASGVVIDMGDGATQHGHCYAKTPDVTVTGLRTQLGIPAGVGGFKTQLTNLEAGTEYYLKAFLRNETETVYGEEISFTTLITTSGIVTDIEGNVYNTVTIGTQTWMKNNLKAIKFNDGTAIPYVTDNVAWGALITPGYCWYNNDAYSFKNTYGALYNWYTVDQTSNGGKNVCPTGWHVPSDVEWTILTNYLTNNGYGYEGSGIDIAKSIAATSGWVSDPTPGNPGNDQVSNNISGFTALPGGSRDLSGVFNFMGFFGYWWSTTEYLTSDDAWIRSMYTRYNDVYQFNEKKKRGLSVRCLRDY